MAVVWDLYQKQLASGEVQANQAQANAIAVLDAAATRSLAHARKKPRTGGFFAWIKRWFFGGKGGAKVQGVYLYGPVGRGKTLVMDMFVQALEPLAPRVKRTHFHRFFADVHQDIHRRRAQSLSTEDVMTSLAADLSQEHDVLAFDEFYVNNIADAMILGRFLEALFKAGILVVFTSNDAPEDLYTGGLQRERFVPTIELLRSRCDLVWVDSGTDYRLLQRRLPATFCTPLGAEADRFLTACLSDLTADEQPTAMTVYVSGTRLFVPVTAGGFARFTFAQLCESPLGRNEYLALAKEFTGILLSDVPQFDDSNSDSAERFRVLIDILYDQSSFFAFTAASSVEALANSATQNGKLARTISRLIEMQSPTYVASALGKS